MDLAAFRIYISAELDLLYDLQSDAKQWGVPDEIKKGQVRIDVMQWVLDMIDGQLTQDKAGIDQLVESAPSKRVK